MGIRILAKSKEDINLLPKYQQRIDKAINELCSQNDYDISLIKQLISSGQKINNFEAEAYRTIWNEVAVIIYRPDGTYCEYSC